MPDTHRVNQDEISQTGVHTVRNRYIQDMLPKLIKKLFERGLGEHLVLHVADDDLILGYLVYDKGHVYLKDTKILGEFVPEQFLPCWESGTLGMVCWLRDCEWESLSFLGLEECAIPVDLSQTRHGVLVAAENQYGDRLIDFVGSIYRGFQLMLENHFLPVALLSGVKSRNGDDGLLVTDLRASPMDIKLIEKIHNLVYYRIQRHLAVEMNDELQMSAEQFQNTFSEFLPRQRSDEKNEE